MKKNTGIILNGPQRAVLASFDTDQLKEEIRIRESDLVSVPLIPQSEIKTSWPTSIRISVKVAREIGNRQRVIAWHVTFDSEGRPALLVPPSVRDYILESQIYARFVRDDYRDKFPHLSPSVMIV